MKGPALARLKAAGMSFVQAYPVKGTDGDDQFVGDDLGFNQEMVTDPVADNLAPNQAPLKRFEQADLFDDCGCGQVIFQNGLELIAGENGGKVESALNRKAVSRAVGHNLQLHPFAEEDHDLLPVPLGKLASKSGFYFLDDFGGGEGVSTG
jgi:hypothetical protein